MRCFIALEIPEEIKEKIVKIQNELGNDLFEGKWISEENLHLTLKFLGDIDSREVDEIVNKLKMIEWKSFEAKISEVGVFSEKFIRILWLHLEGVEKLQKEMDLFLVDLFNAEKRFMSHLTIARVKKVKEQEKFLSKINNLNLNLKFKASSFCLMESKLTHEGPIYEILKRFKSNDSN